MELMTKENIKLQISAQFLDFLQNDFKEESENSETDLLKILNKWLLEKLSDEHYGKVLKNGDLVKENKKVIDKFNNVFNL